MTLTSPFWVWSEARGSTNYDTIAQYKYASALASCCASIVWVLAHKGRGGFRFESLWNTLVLVALRSSSSLLEASCIGPGLHDSSDSNIQVLMQYVVDRGERATVDTSKVWL